MIGTTLLLVIGTYFWSKVQPELIYAICQGYSSQELKIINGLSFKELVLYWGLETATLLALLNIARGLAFSLFLNHCQSLASWQHWLGLCCLLVLTNNHAVPGTLSFWKRWAIFLGATGPLLLPLTQLSLAVFFALLVLTHQKKIFSLSGIIAGMIMSISVNLPPVDIILMLTTCYLTGSDLQSFIQNIPFTKEASKSI